MFKYVVVGRAGSGKSLFLKTLSDSGLRIAKSYTTRPPVDETDDSHFFITDSYEKVANISPDEKRFETTHGGYEYFYLAADIEEADVICLDPETIYKLNELYPNTAFRFICIMASNKDRMDAAVNDADDKITATDDFIKKCEEENEIFTKFEDDMTTRKLDIPNMLIGHIIVNDFSEKSEIFNWANNAADDIRQHDRLYTICEELADNDCLTKTENDKYRVYMKKDDVVDWYETEPALFVEQIIADTEGLARVMSAWLKIEDNSFRDIM